ncbi:MAG: hypothetical protein JW781_00945 [Deltaproteobacteria bacterium]|nr:hypothetical protein [Candidatus Anaeroferrophillacea bacterium]
MEPREIYRRAKSRGMDFVTISDHNRIDGALEIAHLPDTFVSCELTTYFPGNRAKLHLLVAGITEARFADLDRLRSNIYDLRQYIVAHDLVYSLAHPLFRVNDRLTVEQVEKLLVLFNRFEGLNGTRDPRAADLVQVIFGHLTPELIDRLADKHDIEPVGPEPWRKTFTGGSDDHGGCFIASAFTMTPYAETAADFLAHVRAGNHHMGGTSGSSLMLAHSFYQIAYDYYKSRFLSGFRGKTDLLGELLKRLLGVVEAPPAGGGARRRLRDLAGSFVWARRRRQLSPTERMLVDELGGLFAGRSPDDLDRELHERSFETSCRVCHHLAWTFFDGFVRRMRGGELLDSLQTIAALGPVAFSFAPYLAAFSTQHKDEAFHRQLAAHFESSRHLERRSRRVALVGDYAPTLVDRALALAGTLTGLPDHDRQQYFLVTSAAGDLSAAALPCRNFKPVAMFSYDRDEEPSAVFPPFLEVIRMLEQERFDEVMILTPGPMGITALAGARLLNIRRTMVYDPEHAAIVGERMAGTNLGELMERYLCWLCELADRALVGSLGARHQLVSSGMNPARVVQLPGLYGGAAAPACAAAS